MKPTIFFAMLFSLRVLTLGTQATAPRGYRLFLSLQEPAESGKQVLHRHGPQAAPLL
jgi:hypothetical protein